MKTLLTALNAKYVHTNLAVRCIKNYCTGFDVTVKEYTINDNTDAVISGIFEFNADIIAFSCYIWNIEKVLYICECLKKANPNLIIVLGGLEVSYDSVTILKENDYVDYVISGEGEIPFKMLLDALENDKSLDNVLSLTYRKNNEIIKNRQNGITDINDFSFVYNENDDLKNKIVYYESSRGCPYNCSYCLSGDGNKVTFLDTERTKKEIKYFIDNKIPLVKFVDRTFNANKKRADEIFKFIIDNSTDTKFHFELSGDLITDETLNVLKTAKNDIMQFEIGVQSTNKKTIEAIGRKIDFDVLKEKILTLLSFGNIHIHLDLIAGLPYEDLESFKKSFNDVIDLRPDMLQLGFLKLLKGSRIRNEYQKYGYVFKSKAPYEIISNDFMTFSELCYLKKIENVLDKYYNSGDFTKSIDYLFEKYQSKFDIFDKIVCHFEQNKLFEKGLSHDMLYDELINAFAEYGKDFSDCVNFDRILNLKCKIKSNLDEDYDFKERCFGFLKNEENIKKYLGDFANASDTSAKKLIKLVRFEEFFGKIWLFNLKNRKVYDVTKDFGY